MTDGEQLILANLALPIIKDILTPKIAMLIQEFGKSKKNQEEIIQKFNDYISRYYKKFTYLDTLAFPNGKTELKELYQPLTVIRELPNEEIIEILIDNYPEDLLPEYNKVIIEDTAGMGKSTVMKRLFLSIVEEKAGIPILIELKKINSKNDILSEINTQLSSINEIIEEHILLSLIKEGEFIFLFDGYDEIAKANKEFVINEMHSFINKAYDNYFIITSRQEDSLISFSSFLKFRVKPLEQNEAFELLKKYDQYSHTPIANDLIQLLEEKNDESIDEFLENPLLVSLLFTSFEYKKDIPLRKSQFYCQIYDALFERHDLKKEGSLRREKYSKLHRDDFERVLRYLGFSTAMENQVEYDKDYLIKRLNSLKKYFSDLDFKPSDFLHDLTTTVPLFKKDGSYYRWSHKSLQDYFAAKFIWIDAKENQKNILEKIFNDSENKRFYNILDILYELDTKLFEHTVLKWLFLDFKKHYDANIDKEFPVSRYLIKQRIEFSYARKFCLIVLERYKFDEIFPFPWGKDAIQIRKHYDAIVPFDHNYLYFPKSNESKGALLYVFENQNIATILSLLENKCPDLMNNYDIEEMDKKTSDNLFGSLHLDSPYVLTYRKNSILNKSHFFYAVNQCISIVDVFLDSDKCLNRLKEIEEEEKLDIMAELFD